MQRPIDLGVFQVAGFLQHSCIIAPGQVSGTLGSCKLGPTSAELKPEGVAARNSDLHLDCSMSSFLILLLVSPLLAFGLSSADGPGAITLAEDRQSAFPDTFCTESQGSCASPSAGETPRHSRASKVYLSFQRVSSRTECFPQQLIIHAWLACPVSNGVERTAVGLDAPELQGSRKYDTRTRCFF